MCSSGSSNQSSIPSSKAFAIRGRRLAASWLVGMQKKHAFFSRHRAVRPKVEGRPCQGGELPGFSTNFRKLIDRRGTTR